MQNIEIVIGLTFVMVAIVSTIVLAIYRKTARTYEELTNAIVQIKCDIDRAEAHIKEELDNISLTIVKHLGELQSRSTAIRELSAHTLDCLSSATRETIDSLGSLRLLVLEESKANINNAVSQANKIDERVKTTHGDIFTSLNAIKSIASQCKDLMGEVREMTIAHDGNTASAIGDNTKEVLELVEVVRQRLELLNETDGAIRKELNYRNQLRSRASTRIEEKKQAEIDRKAKEADKQKRLYAQCSSLQDKGLSPSKIANKLHLSSSAEVKELLERGKLMNWSKETDEEAEKY